MNRFLMSRLLNRLLSRLLNRGLLKALGTLALASGLVAAVTGCGSTVSSENHLTNQSPGSTAAGASNNSTGTAASNGSSTAGHTGVAQIVYAGSLQLANNEKIRPAFTKVTGYTFQGRGGGSFAMANLIRAGQIQADAFESIGIAPIQSIGTKSATWAVGFASSPLVITYSPQSPFAAQLNAIRTGQKPLKDLFSLMEQPNFHLGRTDPATDPQGQDFVLMMELAQKELHLPAGSATKILGGIENGQQIFQETSILSRLQAGQLDASSAYQPEAIERNLPYITLPDSINLGNPANAKEYASVHMTLTNGTTVKGEPIELYVTALSTAVNPQAGQTFVQFVLSKQGLQLYREEGYAITPRTVWGNNSAVPPAIQSEVTKGS